MKDNKKTNKTSGVEKTAKKAVDENTTLGNIRTDTTIYELARILAGAIEKCMGGCCGKTAACGRGKKSPGEQLMLDFLKEREAKNKVERKKAEIAENPGEFLVSYMLNRSKYDFSGFEVGYRPSAESEDPLVFDIYVGKKSDADGVTQVVTEIFTTTLYGDDPAKSVAEFDRHVGELAYIRPPLKPVDKPVGKPAAKPQPKKGKIRPVVDDLKKTVLECSKYAVPSSRVKFVYDREDKKHRNHVYEVRFFQKSYKSASAETQSYERAELNVRSGGDRDDLVAKRFDKLVEGLKFNEFPAKKPVK